MKRFIITEARPATYYWTYEVEAEDENEALMMVMNDEVEPMNSDVEIDEDAEGEYDIEDAD